MESSNFSNNIALGNIIDISQSLVPFNIDFSNCNFNDNLGFGNVINIAGQIDPNLDSFTYSQSGI